MISDFPPCISSVNEARFERCSGEWEMRMRWNEIPCSHIVWHCVFFIMGMMRACPWYLLKKTNPQDTCTTHTHVGQVNQRKRIEHKSLKSKWLPTTQHPCGFLMGRIFLSQQERISLENRAQWRTCHRLWAHAQSVKGFNVDGHWRKQDCFYSSYPLNLDM